MTYYSVTLVAVAALWAGWWSRGIAAKRADLSHLLAAGAVTLIAVIATLVLTTVIVGLLAIFLFEVYSITQLTSAELSYQRTSVNVLIVLLAVVKIVVYTTGTSTACLWCAKRARPFFTALSWVVRGGG